VTAVVDQRPAVQRYVGHVMGMPISLALRGPEAAGPGARSAWAAALAALRDVDRVFSTWRDDTVISRLGRGELELDKCPEEVREVLALGEVAHAQSGGAFDVHRVVDGQRVLDPSGVVKGWAVDRAARPLRALDADFCLSAGGDMVCHVAGDDSPAWRIGVEDPHDPGRVVAVLPIRTGAVATSGFAHRGGHVVDARTGAVPTSVASVTVVHDELVWADIDATAALAQDRDALRWLRTRRGRRGVVVWADGTRELFGYS
jgi:thiamine biosynthesis lipoprotein